MIDQAGTQLEAAWFGNDKSGAVFESKRAFDIL